MTDRRYLEHWQWWQRAAEVPERWIGAAVSHEGQPDSVTRGDWFARSWGPDDVPAYPQAVKSLTAGRTCPAYQRLIAKATADIERITEETRLERYVARHQPTAEELAAIVTMIRRRQHGDSSTHDDNCNNWHDGHRGQGRACSA